MYGNLVERFLTVKFLQLLKCWMRNYFAAGLLGMDFGDRKIAKLCLQLGFTPADTITMLLSYTLFQFSHHMDPILKFLITRIAVYRLLIHIRSYGLFLAVFTFWFRSIQFFTLYNLVNITSYGAHPIFRYSRSNKVVSCNRAEW